MKDRINLRTGSRPTLADVLEKREALWELTQELEKRYPGCAVVALTLNIPGPYKNNPTVKRIFGEVVDAAEKAFPVSPLERIENADAPTGPYIYWVLDRDASELKEKMMQVEDGHPLGRFCDIDVTHEGEQLKRPLPRKCFICDKPAKICARSRAHSVEELLTALEAKLKNLKF